MWNLALLALGTLGTIYVLYRWKRSRAKDRPDSQVASCDSAPRVGTAKSIVKTDASDPADYVTQLIAQERYALLARPEIVGNLETSQLREAVGKIHQSMSLVPDGSVHLAQPAMEDMDVNNIHGQTINVDGVLLDRFAVTNEQYQQFVDAGGYQDVTLWDTHIWSGVLEFVDQTRRPGPCYWNDGKHDPVKAQHPVVGVNRYEAAA